MVSKNNIQPGSCNNLIDKPLTTSKTYLVHYFGKRTFQDEQMLDILQASSMAKKIVDNLTLSTDEVLALPERKISKLPTLRSVDINFATILSLI